MFIDTKSSIDINSFSENATAGKVNFNTSSSNDYLTNESYKTLRTNILFCGTDIKTILLTSSRANEGKSTISTELAKSLADADKKTLFIDADMRKSVLLPRNMKAHSYYGLSEYLSGQVDINKILYNTQNPNFDVIFSGHFPPNPVELLSNNKFKLFLENARDKYDYIIIDSPPLGAVIDAAVIAAFCDGAIMVITSGKIGCNEALNVKAQLEKSGCKILGAILNDINDKNSKYYKKYYNNYEYSASNKKIKLK